MRGHIEGKAILQAVWTAAFCFAVAAGISFFAPYYIISCERRAEVVNCQVRRVLCFVIPLSVTEIRDVRTVTYEDREPGRRVRYFLEIRGDQSAAFRADRAPSSAAELDNFVGADNTRQLRCSDGNIFFGLYLPVIGILFGLLGAVITVSDWQEIKGPDPQRPIGGLARYAKLVTFLMGAYVTACVAGLGFVYIVDVVLAPWWAWSALLAIVGLGGVVNLIRVRLRQRQAK